MGDCNFDTTGELQANDTPEVNVARLTGMRKIEFIIKL